MIRASAPILGHAATEFTECHHHHTVKIPLGLQVGYKSAHRRIQLAHQLLVRPRLVAMGVVTTLSDIVNTRRHSPTDESGDEVERVRKLAIRIGDGRAGTLRDIEHFVGGHHGIERGALQKIQCLAAPRVRSREHSNTSPVHGFNVIHRAEKLISGIGNSRLLEVEAKLLRLRKRNAARLFCGKRLRGLVSDTHTHSRIFALTTGIKIPPQPAMRVAFIRIDRGLPDLRGAKMRPVGIRISDPLDHGNVTLIVERLQPAEIGI